MSRIGKQPIPLPEKTTVTQSDGQIFVKGPKGQLSLVLHPHVTVTQADNQLTVSVANIEDRHDRALWGLFRTLVANLVTGVTVGYQKQLVMTGVGFKAAVTGKKITFNLGFSHPIEFPLPEGIEAKMEKDTITVSGIDKQLVGAVAANIRRLKEPEPYKGKGIRYSTEVIRRKAGKVVKAAEGAK